MILVDTSVWVEFFRRKEPVFTQLRELIEAGLPFWEGQAERFAVTPYGASVRNDVSVLKSLLKPTGE